MFAIKTIAALFMLFAVVAPMSSAFSLTAILTRRGKPAISQPVSKSLEDFNAQMAAIVEEERRERYYSYVQQTSAFIPSHQRVVVGRVE